MSSTVLKGVVTGIFENERNDVLILDRNTRISMFKGSAKDLFAYKGQAVRVATRITEKDGNTYYNSSPSQVTADGGAGATGGGGQGNKRMNNSDVQESIVFQSMAKVAIELLTHNAALEKRKISTEELIGLAKELASVAINPNKEGLGTASSSEDTLTPPSKKANIV